MRGDVQGVFFRDSCRRAAVERGLSGWVQNNSDGSVEAEFEGPESDVDALVEWCRQGPPHARVEQVDTSSVQPRGETRFTVR